MAWTSVLAIQTLCMMISCGNDQNQCRQESTSQNCRSENPAPSLPPQYINSEAIKLLVLGDSLSSGFDPRDGQSPIPQENLYPALSQAALQEELYNITIHNASIEDSTTEGGPSRLERALGEQSDITHVLIALGSNDGLRCIQHNKTQKHMETMIQYNKSQNVKTFLIRPHFPKIGQINISFLPNLTKTINNYCLTKDNYQNDFYQTFDNLAKSHDLAMWDIAAPMKQILFNFQRTTDLVHPNEEGHKIMAESFVKFLKENLITP